VLGSQNKLLCPHAMLKVFTVSVKHIFSIFSEAFNSCSPRSQVGSSAHFSVRFNFDRSR
jgi:hypothetical protein